MNPTITATRLHAGDAIVTVVSNTPAVTGWSRRYFGPWWNAFEVPAESIGAGPQVNATVDAAKYAELAELVDGGLNEAEEVTYAKARTRVTSHGGGIISAVSPDEQLAYRSDSRFGRLTIAGPEEQPVALAAARLAREAIRGQLLRDGWTLLHASAVVRDGQTLLTFGSKGAGKTTTALLLASRGWELLANDRVFVRPEGDRLQVLPWPSAAAIGLGLLDALDFYDLVCDRLKAGEQLHPTQHQRVTDALMDGSRTPLWEQGGKRELKIQVFPDQFATWFGMTLATGGHAAGLLFPRIEPDAAPALADETRSLSEHDFMSGATEDRYPDIFGLTRVNGGGNQQARTAVTDRLTALPHHSVVLGHDTTANADFLAKLTS
ncbi:phosphoenolpyruvate carboxykinase (ATP) [Actinacidiphila oryziradicis]|uniref:Serine kinase n=1 Tax=Actinacidiphila oryziradicis TaxID=2571141 RepID=A0A4U0SQ14_9ACTN|nr:hypothetical protein [Actinacidiphila oryziradicis]TKA12072.1 hypothetical protein FCI23_07100 [Actinacidiphila oryziradicis]